MPLLSTVLFKLVVFRLEIAPVGPKQIRVFVCLRGTGVFQLEETFSVGKAEKKIKSQKVRPPESGWIYKLKKKINHKQVSEYRPKSTTPQSRVAKCRRYNRYISVNFLMIWGKILEGSIHSSEIG